MKNFDKQAWQILFKRLGVSILWIAGTLSFGVLCYSVTGFVRELEYSEVLGDILAYVAISFLVIVAISVWLFTWKDRIKEELLEKSQAAQEM